MTLYVPHVPPPPPADSIIRLGQYRALHGHSLYQYRTSRSKIARYIRQASREVPETASTCRAIFFSRNRRLVPAYPNSVPQSNRHIPDLSTAQYPPHTLS
eukprot:3650353-Rhodomonas_salina.3